MSQNLLCHGDIARPLTLYNRTKSTAETHAARLGGCRVSESVTDAVAGADIVWLCVQDEEAVEAIFQQIFTIPIRGKLFVDSSTVSGEKADSIALRVADAGGSFVAVPGTYTSSPVSYNPDCAYIKN
jgi:3-hydroxyisobutyrate dehydrogenase-like beta-hydroxyacid dehydrogenase